MSNTSTTTTTNTNRMLLSGSSSLLNSKRRPSVGKIEELIEPMSENYSEQTGLSSVSSKYDNRMESDHKQQQQKRNTELLKAKNYLKTQLKLPEPKADETNNQASNNLTQSMIATTSTKLRSNSFLMGKNNSEIGHLIASFDGTRNANGGNEAVNNTTQHTAPKQLTHQQQLQQQAALKSSLVASTHASLARQHYANKPNNKMSNENLKSSISRIARQKSGDQLKAMSMNEKQLNREVASIKKEEAQTGQAPQANYNPYSSSSSSSSACVYSGNNSTTPPQKSSPTSIPLAQTNIQSHQQQQQQQITMNLASTAQQQQQQQQQQYQQEQLNHRKELLLIPSDKLADYITRSISKLKSEENNAVVDQMASFIDELKDFIDDRLIDTTSQLEMSNRHIYHLYKSVNYLIKEVSSLKIQNEELKQELFILNSRLKSKAHFQPQPQMSHHQQTLINHTNPICCYATLKKTGASAAMPKTNEYLLVESSHPSDEKDLSRLSELSGGDTNNDSVNGRSFYESAFTDEDPRNNLNYLNWQRQQRSKPSVASSSTGGPSSMVTTTNTATTVSGVSNTTNNISNSNPFFTVSASSEIDMDNSISSPNNNNNNNNNNAVIANEKFVSTDENLDNVKMNKLLNCEIDYFKNTGTVVNSKSAGVSPRRSSKTENNLKIIDQLLSSKFVDKRNNNEELESGAMSNAQSKNSDGSSNRRAREILSKSSIIHHLHASLAPFTSLINDFDAQYSWDYTDNNNI